MAGVAGDCTTSSSIVFEDRRVSDWAGYNGIFSNRSKTGFGDISDGSSNTFLFGEIAGQPVAISRVPAKHAWIGAINIGMLTWGVDFSGLSANTMGNRDLDRYNSYHTGVVNFARGDGSVTTIPKDTDFLTMYRLSAMTDGNVVTEF